MERALNHALKRWREDVFPENLREPEPDDDKRWRSVMLLARAARKLLQADGREMLLRVDRSEPGREILRWRFVSLAIPPSILIAAATRGTSAVPKTVRLLNSSIAPDCPVAQNHVHHAAMMSFEELWASLRLRALSEPGEFEAGLRNSRALCAGLHSGVCLRGRRDADRERAKKNRSESARHMVEWGDVIRNAFIARRVLDRHAGHVQPLKRIEEHDVLERPDSGEKECSDRICREGRTILRSFLAGRSKSYSETGTPYPWPNELMRWARYYRKATDPRAPRNAFKSRRTLIDEQTAEERRLLVRAFRHLRPNGTKVARSVIRDTVPSVLTCQNCGFRPAGTSTRRARAEKILGPLSADQGLCSGSGQRGADGAR